MPPRQYSHDPGGLTGAIHHGTVVRGHASRVTTPPDGGVPPTGTPPSKVVEVPNVLKLRLSLVVLRMVFARYGVWAMATGKRVRHAAVGRARRSSWTGAPLHSGYSAGAHPASDLIRYLRRERQEAAFRTYGVIA